MEYNTTKEKLVLPEYGRNIKNLVKFCKTIEDREERTRFAEYVVHLMAVVSNNRQNEEQQKHKLWYHFAMLADFDIDIDFPIETPQAKELTIKPQKMSYPENNIEYRYYGKNIQNIVRAIAEMPDGEEKQALIQMTANQMKRLYVNWNRPQVSDEEIFRDMKLMSDGKLEIPDDLKLMYVSPDNGGNSKNRKKNKKRYKR